MTTTILTYLTIGMALWLWGDKSYLWSRHDEFSEHIQSLGKIVLTGMLIVAWPLVWAAIIAGHIIEARK
jgi:hypothetical protein